MAAADPGSDALIRVAADHFGMSPPARIAVAVSGGSDSLAALFVMLEFAKPHAIEVSAVTVDHGLRDASSDEAKHVASVCQDLGVAHTTLTWRGWSGTGNLQGTARDARYRLMSDWARSRDIGTIVLGHTQDDQAETVLMRLARGAGVDGLSGMKPSRRANGITWARPFLSQRRDVLRAILVNRGVEWIEDPSNHDARFDRVKMRKALDLLEPLGLTRYHLSQVAQNMTRARTALDQQTHDAARVVLRFQAGAVAMSQSAFWALPDEIARRLMNGLLGWISGSNYAPRGSSLSDVLANLRTGHAGTLDGCHVMPHGADLWVFREYQVVQDTVVTPDEPWDARWRVIDPGALPEGSVIKALGDIGLAQCPDWREAGLPHAAVRSTPAVWLGEDLVVASFAQTGTNRTFALENDAEDLFAALLSH